MSIWGQAFIHILALIFSHHCDHNIYGLRLKNYNIVWLYTAAIYLALHAEYTHTEAYSIQAYRQAYRANTTADENELNNYY